MSASCSAQYSGKTIHFGKRMKEHLHTSKQSSISVHKNACHICYTTHDFKVTYVESYHDRGKYTLSERELLWNERIRGSINLQKTLKSQQFLLFPFLLYVMLTFFLYSFQIYTEDGLLTETCFYFEFLCLVSTG